MARLNLPGVTERLAVEVAEGVATVTLDRPKVLNALNQEQRGNLERAFEALDAEASVRAIILCGAGRTFCAGQDQRESAGMDAHGAAQRIETYASLYTRMRSVRKPIIARIHGYAAGAGLQLALLSDLRIASDETKLGMTELSVGSAAIMGSAFLLPLVGEAAMKRLVLYSDFIPASEARALGLLTEVVAPGQLEARVQEIAAGLAARAPLGVALTKEWWRLLGDGAFNAAMDHARKAHATNFAAGGLSESARRFVSGERDAS